MRFLDSAKVTASALMRPLVLVVVIAFTISFVDLIAQDVKYASSPKMMALHAPPDTTAVTGYVVAGESAVPNVSVHLVNRRERLEPVMTDGTGTFEFKRVPLSKNEADPYYVEVYWGSTLVYQQPLIVLDTMPLNFVVRLK